MHNVHYAIAPADPGAHLFQVTCRIKTPHSNGQHVSLPAWIPGSYMIRDFAQHIIGIEARCGGRSVNLVKLDKDSWQADPCDGELVIDYHVYAWDLSVRAAHLDITHGFFNGTSVFLRVHGQEQNPCSVELLPPPESLNVEWRVATSLPRMQAAPHAFGLYQARNYDELIDHPVEMGHFMLAGFMAGGVPHEIAVTGRHEADLDKLCTDLIKICEQHIEFFGECPVDYYLFLLTVVGDGYGGLEHRNSCSLLASRNSLPRRNEKDMSDDYRGFLGLCSHEYFHTWNVKRIKPAVFSPYDLQKENYTRQLWAFEGITSYYDDLGLCRAGLISEQSYLELFGRTISQVLRSRGRYLQTVSESSFDAWTKFYKQNENAPNAIVSYYSKGALIAFCLDMTIREASDNNKSLDDVMQLLWRRYGASQQGVPEGAIEELASEVAGENLSRFFELALRSTEDLPLEELLELLGITYNVRASTGRGDMGGKPVADKQLNRVDLGVRVKAAAGDFAKVTHVFNGAAAHQAGLSAGDIIISIDELRASYANFDKQIQVYDVGDVIKLRAFRRDELMRFKVSLQAPEPDCCYLTQNLDAEDEQLSMRQSWLSS